ncbi:MAG: inositol monophosphatase [Chloroflexi bacterium]|nr:inositol monophosphatase [Chloroflexota bacterium]
MVRELPVGRSGTDALHLAVALAEQAGELILETSTEVTTSKGRGNVVTAADLAAEEHIRKSLEKEFPTHGIVGEEFGSQIGSGTSSYQWIVDPLDGTMNFHRRIPFFAVSIALFLDDQPLLGVVYDPVRRECFSGRRGSGVTVDGQPIQVGNSSSLESALIAYDLGYIEDDVLLTFLTARTLAPRIQRSLSLGSCALGLAYVAAGRLDAYYHLGTAIWDFAAGWLLAEEAGATVSTFEGQPVTDMQHSSVLAAAPPIHTQLLKEFGNLT